MPLDDVSCLIDLYPFIIFHRLHPSHQPLEQPTDYSLILFCSSPREPEEICLLSLVSGIPSPEHDWILIQAWDLFIVIIFIRSHGHDYFSHLTTRGIEGSSCWSIVDTHTHSILLTSRRFTFPTSSSSPSAKRDLIGGVGFSWVCSNESQSQGQRVFNTSEGSLLSPPDLSKKRGISQCLNPLQVCPSLPSIIFSLWNIECQLKKSEMKVELEIPSWEWWSTTISRLQAFKEQNASAAWIRRKKIHASLKIYISRQDQGANPEKLCIPTDANIMMMVIKKSAEITIKSREGENKRIMIWTEGRRHGEFRARSRVVWSKGG